MMPTLILYNGRIRTLDTRQPSATAIAIQHGDVRAVGKDDTILAEFEECSERFDLNGRTVIPGLIDAHIHLAGYALSLQKIDCETPTRAECLQRVAERVRSTPHGEWILGHGWNQNDWSEGFGCAADLDAIAPNHPVYLTAKSLHAAWVNSQAMRLANVSAQTPDPPAGRLGRDSHGEPDGILFETAMELVSKVVPEVSLDNLVTAIRAAQHTLWSMGLTGIHDFDRRLCFAALQILHSQDELGLRVVKSIPLEDLPNAVELGLRTGFGDDWLRIGGIKIFSDGALGPRTAAMLQPYEGVQKDRGMLMMDAEEMVAHGQLATRNGLSLAIHAIGDRANREVLNAFAQIREFELSLVGKSQNNHSSPSPLKARLQRHRIEHVQLIHPDDAMRLASLGVIASMQPIHATSDMHMADRHWGERAAFSYAWRELTRQGAVLAFGSDAPVESPNPFWGIHAAVTRRHRDGRPGPEGWYPTQRMTLAEALHGFTTGAAIAAGMEDRLGKLAPGYLADLVVLDTDPFTCEVDNLHAIAPLATMVAGKWIWQKEDFS